MNNDEIKNKIIKFGNIQNWMHNYEVIHNVWTIKHRESNFSFIDSDKQLKNKAVLWKKMGLTHALVYYLSLEYKTILDVACGEGLYSFIAAKNGCEITAIDIDPLRIAKSNYIKSVTETNNINFINSNIYNFSDFTNVDLILCLGIMHRIPDPFNFINIISPYGKMILFEYISAPKFLDQNIPWCFHTPGKLYEFFNAKNFFEDRLLARKSRAGGGYNRADYLYMSFAFLETICIRCGFNYFIRFAKNENFCNFDNILSKRVMLLASKEPIKFLDKISRFGLMSYEKPYW